ncbi:MAG: hypothetical protein FWE82_07280 [Defluviitaleaceae bacterium]|nr:hypothetical protein [Defluviitaleaceae bacterium]
MEKKWWLDEVNLVTLGILSGNIETDKSFLEFYKKIGSRIADRGYVYPHFSETVSIGTELIDFYHKHGLKFISFTSVGKWGANDVEALIAASKIHIDDGADGVHFDMFFSPVHDDKTVADAVAEISREIKKYAAEKYGRTVCFAGNEWVMENRTALAMANICDVVWIESYAYNALEIVRSARLGRAIGGASKPVWYHWQPEDDAKSRIYNLKNLPKAMFAACLFESALFLCNPQYPVFDTKGEDQSQEFLGSHGKWYIIPINDGWKNSVYQYAASLRDHKNYYIDAVPKAELLFAFTPAQIGEANRCMNLLLAENIPSQPFVYGENPHGILTEKIKSEYKRALVLGEDAASADDIKAMLPILKEEASQLIKLETTEKIIAGVMEKDGKTLVHLLHHGYSDETDILEPTGPVRITVRLKNIKKATLVSPDMGGEITLPFSIDGESVSFTVPGVTYYSLVILE